MAHIAVSTTLVNSTKVGVLETLKESGMLNKQNQPAQTTKQPSESMSFKDLPVEGKVQMAAKAGIQLDPMQLKVEEAKKEMKQSSYPINKFKKNYNG